MYHIYDKDVVFRRLVFLENRFSSQKIFGNLKRPEPSPEVGRAGFRHLDVASLDVHGCCSVCRCGEDGLRVRSPGSRTLPFGVNSATMNGKSTHGSLGGMACIEGLPPLPKSLSGLLNSSGGSWRDMERMYVKKTMIQDELSRGRNNADSLLAHRPANLDGALALLRKEMVRIARLFT